MSGLYAGIITSPQPQLGNRLNAIDIIICLHCADRLIWNYAFMPPESSNNLIWINTHGLWSIVHICSHAISLNYEEPWQHKSSAFAKYSQKQTIIQTRIKLIAQGCILYQQISIMDIFVHVCQYKLIYSALGIRAIFYSLCRFSTYQPTNNSYLINPLKIRLYQYRSRIKPYHTMIIITDFDIFLNSWQSNHMQAAQATDKWFKFWFWFCFNLKFWLWSKVY